MVVPIFPISTKTTNTQGRLQTTWKSVLMVEMGNERRLADLQIGLLPLQLLLLNMPVDPAWHRAQMLVY